MTRHDNSNIIIVVDCNIGTQFTSRTGVAAAVEAAEAEVGAVPVWLAGGPAGVHRARAGGGGRGAHLGRGTVCDKVLLM